MHYLTSLKIVAKSWHHPGTFRATWICLLSLECPTLFYLLLCLPSSCYYHICTDDLSNSGSRYFDIINITIIKLLNKYLTRKTWGKRLLSPFLFHWRNFSICVQLSPPTTEDGALNLRWWSQTTRFWSKKKSGWGKFQRGPSYKTIRIRKLLELAFFTYL